MLLALAFTAAVAAWLQWSEGRDAEDERATLDSRITVWLSQEQERIATLAAALPDMAHGSGWPVVDEAALMGQPTVTAGLQRLWISATVLDAGNRIVAHVPTQAQRAGAPAASAGLDDGGLTAHLSAPVSGGGRLVVRFAPASLLRLTVPWWLARRYEVRLVDGLGQLIAGSPEPRPSPGRASHRVTVEPALADTWLELTSRELRVPWWRTEAAWRRAIEDALTVGLRGRDMQGRLMHVNRAFCDLVGLPPEQLLGRLPPMPYWPPDGQEAGMRRHLRNMAGGAPREGYETRWVRPDGSTLDVMVFEAALAHQLNQPLTAIAGYNAGVLRALESAGYADRMVLGAVRRLGEQAAEAGRIVQRIRGFLTRRAPQRESCDAAAIVQHALGLLRRDLQRQHIAVQVAVDADLPAVYADPVLIEQVLINLLRNAADELVAAGVAQPCVRVGAAAAADGAGGVQIAVDDNGPGLRGRRIDELSAPFYSTKADGMGMGLAICRSVVEAHHGALLAQDSPLPGFEGGARLVFALPVMGVADAAPTTQAAA